MFKFRSTARKQIPAGTISTQALGSMIGLTRPIPLSVLLHELAFEVPADAFPFDFSQIPPATTPHEADKWFDLRAELVTTYNACHGPLVDDVFHHELSFTTVAIAKLERALQGHGTRCFDHTQEQDNITQVNDALLRSQVRSKLGTTSSFPCSRTGEYDVALRGFIPIMYRYRQLLRPEVFNHVLHTLLTVSGPHDPAIELVDCPGIDIIPIPETENHVLMIETSRYLTNQLLHDESSSAGQNAPQFDNEANGMNDWILEKLQSFLMNDFSEYNARTYQIYTAMALQNLNDFARDPRVKLGAQMVLDYVSAKVAVSSNGLRRAVPFRRPKEYTVQLPGTGNDPLFRFAFDYKDSTPLFDNNCDPQTLRFILLSGLTQRLTELNPPKHVTFGAQDIMQLAAISSYRVPRMVLDLLMNKTRQHYYQRFHHAGVELYASSPEFLISAGGFWMESTHGNDEINGYADAGWSLPTTLMPTMGGTDRAELIRINGSVEDHERTNTGVAPGFACGLNPFVPPSYFVATNSIGGNSPPCSVQHGPWTFIDASGHCNYERAYGFYAVIYSSPCTTVMCSQAAFGNPLALSGGSFGFLEATSANGLTFADFQRMVLDRNENRAFTSEGRNEYVTIENKTIRFTPNPPGNKYQWGIEEAGVASDIGNWPLAQGDIVNSDGHSGLVTIDNPAFNMRLVLDFRDHLNPRRTVPSVSLRQFLVMSGAVLARGLRDDLPVGVKSLRSLLAR